MFEAIIELIDLVFEGLHKLSSKNVYYTFGLAFMLSIVCAIISNFYTKLWNKKYNSTNFHKFLTAFASVFTFIFVLIFVGLTFLNEIAQFKVIKWSGELIEDKPWQDKIARNAYDLVKESGLENLQNLDPSKNNAVTIPITNPQTLETCANYFSKSACENFDQKHPFLSKVVWSKSKIPSDVVSADVAEYFGSGNINATNESGVTALSNVDEFEKRILRENGQSGQIQISLIWNNNNDLDLHCVEPGQMEIFYGNKISASGGILDIDMNRFSSGENSSDEPVENIKWNIGDAPKGNYTVYINHYKNHGSPDPTLYQIRVKTDDKIEIMDGEITAGEGKKLVYSFDYQGKITNAKPPYEIRNAIALVSKTLRDDMTQQAPRVVYVSRIMLVILFLIIQSIPFGLIGYGAYRDLKINT